MCVHIYRTDMREDNTILEKGGERDEGISFTVIFIIIDTNMMLFNMIIRLSVVD